MFASSIKKDLSFGDDSIQIRKLSGYQLDLARDEAAAKNIGQLRRLGGELVVAMNSNEMNEAAKKIKEKKAEKKENDPKAKYEDFDRMTSLKQGIITFGAGRPSTDELIRDLDEETAQTTFEAIIDLTIPSKAEFEATEEKGS